MITPTEESKILAALSLSPHSRVEEREIGGEGLDRLLRDLEEEPKRFCEFTGPWKLFQNSLESPNGWLYDDAMDTKPTTCKQVEKYLAANGIVTTLVRGKGYFYFWGEREAGWPTSSVATNTVRALSLVQWLDAYLELEMQADGEAVVAT